MDGQEKKTDDGQQTTEQAQSEMVPKERLDEVSARLEAEQEARSNLEQQLALTAANTVAPQAQQPVDDFEAAGIKIEDRDMPLSAEETQKLTRYQAEQYKRDLAELHFKLDHPDFAQVVGTPEQIASGQYAKPLADAIKADPSIAVKIAQAANPRAAAYRIAKLFEARAEAAPEQTEEQKAAAVIQEVIAASERPGSASAAPGQAGIDSASKVAKMSDEEFEAYTEAVIAGEA